MRPYNGQCWVTVRRGKIPWLEGTKLNAQLTFIWTIQTTGISRNGSEILQEEFQEWFMMFYISSQDGESPFEGQWILINSK